MTQLQKLIKYLAIAFAIFLIVSIISGLFGIFASVSYFSEKRVTGGNAYEITEEAVSDGNAKNLTVKIGAAELEIKKGDVLRAESDSEHIICTQDGDTMIIKEKSHSWISKRSRNTVRVYIPENFVFDAAGIEAGAGKLSIDSLSAESLKLEIGAGEMRVNELNASRQADLEIGAGEMTISSGNISNLDLEVGMGKLNLTSALSGNSKIDFGIGEVNLCLIGGEDDYSIKLDKGVGSATVNGTEMHDNETRGNGVSSIELDGGIGSVNVDFIMTKQMSEVQETNRNLEENDEKVV